MKSRICDSRIFPGKLLPQLTTSSLLRPDRRAFATWTIALVIGIVFALQLTFDATAQTTLLVRMGALVASLSGVITVTVTLKKVSCGTEVSVEQAGVPAVIPAEACYLGWQESLAQLAHLVEPEIPN